MINLISIIKKDLHLLLRSRGSASVIILGPLIMILLIGLGFNTSNAYRINVASYSESYSLLAESILLQLKTDQFIVSKTESQESCINSITYGLNHICMIIPSNLEINDKESKTITFYVDYSRINLVYAILDSISRKIETKSSEISLELTQSLLDVIQQTGSELEEGRTIIGSISLNNNLIETKVASIDSKLDTLSTSLTTPGLSASIENITDIIETSNLSSQNQDYIADNLALIELELSEKLSNIEEVKTAINNELISLSQLTENSGSGLDNISSSISQVSSKIDTIAIKNAKRIVSPISTSIQPITVNGSNLNYIFHTLLVLLLSFTSMILAATLVLNEKTSNAFFRNAITPTKDIAFILANYLTPLIISMSQLLVILIIASIFFKGALLSNIMYIILIMLLSSSLFIFMGMFIGNIFKSGETANIAVISILSTLIFFSNIILPIESLPSYIRTLAELNPIVVSETILKRAILFNADFNNLYKGMVILLLYMLMLSIMLFIQYRFIKESYKIKRIIDTRKNG